MSSKKIGSSALPYLFMLSLLVFGIPLLNQKAIEKQQQINVQHIEIQKPKV